MIISFQLRGTKISPRPRWAWALSLGGGTDGVLILRVLCTSKMKRLKVELAISERAFA
jgi:hypothetical protein